MAYPTVQSITEDFITTRSTTHNITMPATVNAGDLLIIFIQVEFQNQIPATPSGWTVLDSDNLTGGASGKGSSAIFAISAVGDEDSTEVNCSTAGSCVHAAQTYRITGWGGTVADDIDITAQTNATLATTHDIPSVTAGWGSDENLFICWLGCTDDDEDWSSGPTNYTNATGTITTLGTNLGSSCITARRELTAASDDPGNMTITASAYTRTALLVIKPAASGTNETVYPFTGPWR
jgi:hypothetical protein